ncbi:CSON005797 protein, partial [Gryllus bimaculatus]
MSANKEKGLRELLAAMKKEWEDVCFETMTFKDLDCPILAKVSDVQAVLDDHLMKTLSMKGSVFVKPIE